jgi:hypothetical protein
LGERASHLSFIVSLMPFSIFPMLLFVYGL